MNPMHQENFEFIREVLQGHHDQRYTMPKGAKFLVMDKRSGKMMAKLEVAGDEKVIGYYEDSRRRYFQGSGAGFTEVLRKQVDLV